MPPGGQPDQRKTELDCFEVSQISIVEMSDKTICMFSSNEISYSSARRGRVFFLMFYTSLLSSYYLCKHSYKKFSMDMNSRFRKPDRLLNALEDRSHYVASSDALPSFYPRSLQHQSFLRSLYAPPVLKN